VRATAVQDAGAFADAFRNARSVSDCASPLALRGVTALGKDLRAAQAAADIAVKRIQCEGAHFRHDSAAKAF